VHHAQDDRRHQAQHKRHCEVVQDDGHLLGAAVVRHDHRAVLARVVAWELRADGAVLLCELAALHFRRVAAALDVDQEHGGVRRRVRHGHGLPQSVRRVLAHVVRNKNVRTLIHIRRAPLAARTPGAVEDAVEVLAARCGARDGLVHEVGVERGERGVHVQGHEEEQRRAGGHRDEREQRGGVEAHSLLPRPADLVGPFGLCQLQQAPFAQLLLLSGRDLLLLL